MRNRKTTPAAQRRMNYWHIAIIIGLSLVAFANSLPGSFVWDDEIQVVKNWRIRSFENLPSAFTSAFWSFLGTEAESQTNFYRPVQTITYMLAYAVGGLSPAAYHAFNIVYHAAAGVFVYLVCLELVFPPTIALGVAALFAVHPVHTEAVAWIAGVPDVACGAFYFGSVWLFLTYLRTRRPSWLRAACAAFFAALLAKEMAVTLPFFLLLVLTLREHPNDASGGLQTVAAVYDRRRCLPEDRGRSQTAPTVKTALKVKVRLISPFFAVLSLYLVLRFSALGLLARSHVDIQATWIDWLSLGVRVLAEYIRYSLVSYPLNAFHLVPVKLQYRLIPTFIAFAVILVFTGLVWRLRHRIPGAPSWFASFVLMLAPVFYFKGISNVFFAERYLYIPSFAMLALVFSFARSLRLPKLNLVVGGIAVIFTVASVYRNQTWKTSEALYQTTLKMEPEVVHMRINLADVHMKRSEDAVAQSLLESSVRYMDSDRYARFPHELYRAEVGLGAIAARAGKYAEARQHFERAIQINPAGDWSYLYLGGVFMEETGDYTRAIENFTKAIKLGPLNEVARDYLGIAMLNQGNYKDAIRYFQEALKINPNYEDARSHLAIASRALTP